MDLLVMNPSLFTYLERASIENSLHVDDFMLSSIFSTSLEIAF